MENKIITLRTPFKLKEYHLAPTKQPNGLNWPWVKPVRIGNDGESYMDLSEAERADPNHVYFIPEDMDITVTEGTTFDLSDPLQYNKWMSIKDHDVIAPMRDARDADGNLLIDGNKKRYGIAELYVDVAGEDSARSIDRRKIIHQAIDFVLNDSANGILTKCKLLGRNMMNAPLTDAQDYLMQEADKHPQKIIDLYTGQNSGIQLLILDAKEKGILVKTNGWFMYGDTNLGANEDAVLTFLKSPVNKPIFDMLKAHVYPEYATQIKAMESAPQSVSAPPINPVRKTTTKKSS